MRATTYLFATDGELGRELARQLFRSTFQEGLELGVVDNVLAVSGRLGIDPAKLQTSARSVEIKVALRAATDAAHQLGVIGVPSLAVGDEIFWGDDRLEDAAAHLQTTSVVPQRIVLAVGIEEVEAR